MMVADLGYNETARRLNIKPGTIRQWANRGNWNRPTRTDQRVTLVTTPPVIAHANALKELEAETKLSFARYGARAAKDAEKATLRDAGLVQKAIQGQAIIHNWGSESKNTQILNVAVLTGQEIPEKIVHSHESE